MTKGRWLESAELLTLVRGYLTDSERLDAVEKAILAESELLRPMTRISEVEKLAETYRIRVNRWLSGEGPRLEEGLEFVQALETLAEPAGLVVLYGETASWYFLITEPEMELVALLSVVAPA